MFKNILPSFKSGFNKLRDNPQLWQTLLVAIVIFAAFLFMADRFVSIAQDAQDRLVNVRLGALQESLVKLAPDYLETPSGVEDLNLLIRQLAVANSSVRKFSIVVFNEQGDSVIVADLSNQKIGEEETSEQLKFILNLAKTDSENSFTIEKFENQERTYLTSRVIVDKYDRIIGAVITEQSLSEADLIISENINNSIIIFILIVALTMFLFFKHARIVDYTHLYKKLQELDSLKDDFISMASHELRTPLTVIRGYAEEISEATEMNEEVKQSVSRIDIAAKQLDNLVADMLDVSRIEQGRMQINSVLLNPLNIINEAFESYKMVAENKGLKLILENSIKGPLNIKADPNKLKQILVNLVGNAIKYTLKGEITIKVLKVSDNLEIRISDTGLGMSAEDQKNLFQKFYRVKTDDTSKIRGTGLGLWITKQIVELMNGKISVESILGKGSDFIVQFPIED